jgi:hypothetical protein
MAVPTGMPRLRGTGARVYYAALFLCPPAFRREFSSEMALDVDEAADDTRREGRAYARLMLWARISADLATTVVVQWLRTGLPVLALCSVAGAIAATRVAANVLWHEPVSVPAAAYDRDVLTLLFLTGTVLLVIVATILFTFWFSAPLLRRRRR